jgi:hypothetical protein
MLHMPLGRVGLADAEAQSESPIQACMGEIKLAATIQAVHQFLVILVPIAMTKAHQIQRCRGGDFEALVLLYPFQKLLRHCYVPPDMKL